MSEVFGNALNPYPNIDYITGSSPQEIKAQLLALKIPFSIVAMYSVNASHICWINPHQKIKKEKTKNNRR